MFVLCFVKRIKYPIDSLPKRQVQIHIQLYRKHQYCSSHMWHVFFHWTFFVIVLRKLLICVTENSYIESRYLHHHHTAAPFVCNSLGFILLDYPCQVVLFQNGFVIMARWLPESLVILFFMSKGKIITFILNNHTKGLGTLLIETC